MRFLASAACAIIIAGILVAGCTQSPASPATPADTRTPEAAVPSTAAVVQQAGTFTLGDHYLRKSYSFQSETDTQSEQFRVDNASWGIDFSILPLNDDPQYCWFEMTVTNLDNGQKNTYGFGRTYGYVLHQQIPMYVMGPYQIDMKGNRVKVDLTAAKRNP